MASVNKVIIAMYVEQAMSMPAIHLATGTPISTIRYALNKEGVLRSRTEGIRRAAADGRIGDALRGKTRTFSPQWRANLSASKVAKADIKAKGFSLKPSGYLEHTRGPHKGRGQHVVVMEELLGRNLLPDECVHHKDGNRSNNSPDNLELMTRAEHARHHASENHVNRKRNKNGQFE